MSNVLSQKLMSDFQICVAVCNFLVDLCLAAKDNETKSFEKTILENLESINAKNIVYRLTYRDKLEYRIGTKINMFVLCTFLKG